MIRDKMAGGKIKAELLNLYLCLEKFCQFAAIYGQKLLKTMFYF